MQKVLIANQNVEQNKNVCQHLTKDKRLEVIGTTDGLTTLKKYLEIKPDILILDSHIEDINYIEIIDRLSTNIKEKRTCNIVLTTGKNEKLSFFRPARIYEVIYGIEDNLDILSQTIDEMYIYGEYEDLTVEELDLLFLKLKIPLNSNGTDYIREAIFECYYYPDLQKKLKDIFSVIGKRHNKTNSAIRSGFRTALERLNIYKNSIDCPIMQYFDCSQNITPKEFLEITVMYLHHQKGKKK